MPLTLVPGAFAADPEDNYGVTLAILHDPTGDLADKYLYNPGSHRINVTKAEAGAGGAHMWNYVQIGDI